MKYGFFRQNKNTYIQIRNSQCIVFTIGNTKEVKSSIKIQEKRIVYLSNFFIWLIRKYIFLTKSLRSSLLDNALVLERFQKPRFRYDSGSWNLRIGSIPVPT